MLGLGLTASMSHSLTYLSAVYPKSYLRSVVGNEMHNVGKRSASVALRRAGAAQQPSKHLIARGAHKQIKFSHDGRQAMLRGVDILAKAVSVTLGPKGKLEAAESI
jgi:hypothetical protein